MQVQHYPDLIPLTTDLVVHLLRAVEHVDHDSQSPAQVLGGLRLAGAGRSGWGPAHGEVEGLGQSDVAPGEGEGGRGGGGRGGW